MANGAYVAHRENQRELILEVAEELFINKGIEQVTIGDIAEGSRLTRATIYKYFSNKEEIAGEIYKNVAKLWVERDRQDVWGFAGNGWERLERFVVTHFDNLFLNPHEARMSAEFNYMYSKKLSVAAAKEIFLESLEGERQRLLECIKGGQEDGSLREDIDPDVLLASVLNFNSGMMNRLGELGDKVEGEYGLGVETIFRQICRLFLDGFKPQASPRAKAAPRAKRASSK